MKKVNQKILTLSILFIGLFVGVFKGQEARTHWINKMKDRYENRKARIEKPATEVDLDDFELASFHKN